DLPEPVLPQQADYTPQLLAILGSWNVCSKEWVIRQYDHEVQGGSVIKPLVGAENDGPGDACVVTPVYGSTRGISLGCGMNPKYGDIDPYWMAASAIDEAVRNVVAVGANPSRIALLDNFCWGNCDKPDRLGSLVRAAQGCRDVALAYGTPFISGKDSLNNEFATDSGETIAIPPSLLISAMAIVNDVRRCTTMDAKKAGNVLYIVGLTRAELGGSHYYALAEHIGNDVPRVDLEVAPRIFRAVASAIQTGLVRACHDLSEGGLAIAAAEMAFAGGLGIKIDLKRVPRTDDVVRDDVCLFSESNTRFLIEVTPENQKKFEKVTADVPVAGIGRINDGGQVEIIGLGGSMIINADIESLKSAWKKPLAW
ncbi:MAG: AIR synthase-related protein, partial [Phycisphaerae bacterium]|nr:AIR synthase-related protein [Phycisphaerae bacterium]